MQIRELLHVWMLFFGVGLGILGRRSGSERSPGTHTEAEDSALGLSQTVGKAKIHYWIFECFICSDFCTFLR